jgi:hypothetical protein
LFGNFRRKTGAGAVLLADEVPTRSKSKFRISHHNTVLKNVMRHGAVHADDQQWFEAAVRVIVERTVSDVVNALRESKWEELPTPARPVGDALAAARSRGAAIMKAHLLRPENLGLDAAAEYAGRSARHINQLRQKGELYALAPHGSSRGFRYPQWQFDADAARRRQVVKTLTDMDIDCWTLHEFVTRPNDALGMTPRQAISDPSVPLEAILQAVKRRFGGGDQGAS